MRNLFIIMLSFSSLFVHGQTLAEWFNQKETQIQYLADQIAANKVYFEYLEKGYAVARSGLGVIEQIKSGDFTLHRDFFNSLSNINPAIKNYSRIADIIQFNAYVLTIHSRTITVLTESKMFSAGEIDHTTKIFEAVSTACLKNLVELYKVITTAQLQLKDDERIRRIDQLFVDTMDHYSFSRSFSEECSLLGMQRLKEQKEIEISKRLNGLK